MVHACAMLASTATIVLSLVHALDTASQSVLCSKVRRKGSEIQQKAVHVIPDGVVRSAVWKPCVPINLALVMASAAMGSAHVLPVILATLAICLCSHARRGVAPMEHARLIMRRSVHATMGGLARVAKLPGCIAQTIAIVVEHAWTAFALAMLPMREALVRESVPSPRTQMSPSPLRC